MRKVGIGKDVCGYSVTTRVVCVCSVYNECVSFLMKMKSSVSYIHLLRQSQSSIWPKKTRNLYGSPTLSQNNRATAREGTHSDTQIESQHRSFTLILKEKNLSAKELETTIETSKNIQLQHLVWCGQITSSSSTFPFLLSISFRTALSTKRLE